MSRDPSIIAVDLVLGFILNIPSEYRVGPVQLPLRRKHWVAVKRVRGAYYNLDSKLQAPLYIGQVRWRLLEPGLQAAGTALYWPGEVAPTITWTPSCRHRSILARWGGAYYNPDSKLQAPLYRWCGFVWLAARHCPGEVATSDWQLDIGQVRWLRLTSS